MVPVQTSDAQTSDATSVGPVQMDHCFEKFQTMNSTRSYSLIPISLQPAVVDLRYFKQ